MIERLGNGKCYNDSCFSDDIVAENISNSRMESTISSWDYSDQN